MGANLSRPDPGIHNFIFCPAVLKKTAGLFYLTKFPINRLRRGLINTSCAFPCMEARFLFGSKILSAYHSRAPPPVNGSTKRNFKTGGIIYVKSKTHNKS